MITIPFDNDHYPINFGGLLALYRKWVTYDLYHFGRVILGYRYSVATRSMTPKGWEDFSLSVVLYDGTKVCPWWMPHRMFVSRLRTAYNKNERMGEKGFAPFSLVVSRPDLVVDLIRNSPEEQELIRQEVQRLIEKFKVKSS